MTTKFRNIKLPIQPTEERLVVLSQFFIEHFDSIQKEYAAFCIEANETLTTVKEYFSKKIEPDPTFLADDLSNLTSVLFYVGENVANSQTFCSIYDIIFFCEKSKAMSESDRKAYTNVKTLHQKNLLAQLKNADDRLGTRISVCQSILKAEMIKLNRAI